MYRNFLYILISGYIFSLNSYAQDVSLFQQFNGNIDYTAIGNTLNEFENNLDRSFCSLLPGSTADLNLANSSNILAAYLYWAGSGEGDQEVTINGTSVTAEEIYHVTYNDLSNGELIYFSCVSEITDLVRSLGNASYQFSDLDISETLSNNPGYCENRTNFAGWSIYVIYENDTLPINQISLFQGLEIIDRNVPEKNIILDNINVLDNNGAKIGFLAWEGDKNLNYGETLSINGTVLSTPPLNPADNAFNGTNAFTNSNTFYNGDLDFYNIQNNISIGDTAVNIKLTTGDTDITGIYRADLIIINNIITVLNSMLPDATIAIDDYFLECANRNIELHYTIYNQNSTDILQANTPISFYANDELIGRATTENNINIDDYESAIITLTIPDNIPDNFTLTTIVDDHGFGNGAVVELNELNNNTVETITLLPFPETTIIPPLTNCDTGFNTATFDLTNQLSVINQEENHTLSYFETLEDLQSNTNNIIIPEYYQNTNSPQHIFIRLDNSICYNIYQFDLLIENCPPTIPQGFSPNNDGKNDWFNIQGLYDIFEKHELLIYNRYGTLIFSGNNQKRWNGEANRGLNNKNKSLPVGTYFYVLNLNDSNFKVLTGWVYLNR